jgi:excisionase family DNA binding protein
MSRPLGSPNRRPAPAASPARPQPSPAGGREVYSLSAAARWLGMSRRVLSRLAHAGAIPARWDGPPRPGRKMLLLKSDLLAYVEGLPRVAG